MSCYSPYCVSGVPYFSVLTKCGFEGQGGIIDCIQPINMSGINELLVSQGGSTMSRYHRERLNELETLLEFPPQVSAAELDSRYEDLCKVLEKARNIFSCRLEEEQENPFHELRVQLQKAKDRFHVRLAGENNTKPLRSSRFKTKSGAKSVQNPFQELRDAFRMARKHFIPLIDQYISTGNNCNTNAIRERAGSRLDGQSKPTTAVDINPASVEDSSTILSTNPIDDYCKPRPVNACKDISTQKPVFIPSNKENAVDSYCTIRSENPTKTCSNPSIACKETSRMTVSFEINEQNAGTCCSTILSEDDVEECCRSRPLNEFKDLNSREIGCVKINTENAVDCCSTTPGMSLMKEVCTQRPSNVYEGKTSLESDSLQINKDSAVDCCCTIPSTNPTEGKTSVRCTIPSTNPAEDCSTTQLSNVCNEMSSRETVSVEIKKDDAVDSCTIVNKTPTDDHFEHRPLNSSNEVSSRAASNILGREEMPRDSFSDKVTRPHSSTTGRLEALITKELQRRKEGLLILENQAQSDRDRSIIISPGMSKPIAEVEAVILEQLSSPAKIE